MTKQVLNTSKNSHSHSFNPQHTDTALLHLEGGQGLLLMLGDSLEDQDCQLLESHQYAAAAETIRALLGWSVDELVQDIDNHTNTIQLIHGTSAALHVFACMHNDVCGRSSNRIQIATLYSLYTVIGECFSRVIYSQEQAMQNGKQVIDQGAIA